MQHYIADSGCAHSGCPLSKQFAPLGTRASEVSTMKLHPVQQLTIHRRFFATCERGT